MAKPNSKGRNKPKYVGLSHSMIDSLAFQSLSPKAIALLVYMFRRYNGFNNGDISFSCREAANLLYISKDTANKAFQELTEKGFIRIDKDSSFFMKKAKAIHWEITCWPLKSGTAPTNDWCAWKPENSEHGTITKTDGTIARTRKRPETKEIP